MRPEELLRRIFTDPDSPPRGLPVVACPNCGHRINEHLSTESSGPDGGGLNGCEHVGDPICMCFWTPNDIAARVAAGEENGT